MTKIHIMTGPHQGRSYELKGDSVMLGRSPDNSIRVMDRYVSRRHLTILRRGGKYFIKDLRSKNGTFVDGNLVASEKEVEVKEGVPIVIGMSVLCIGEECSEDVLSFLNSVGFHRTGEMPDDIAGQERPLTQKRNMELIKNVSLLLSESSNVRDIARKMLYHIFELLPRIDRGVILLLDTGTGKVAEAVSRSRKHLNSRRVSYDLETVNRVIRSRKPLLVSPHQSKEEEDALPDTSELKRIKSVMCVPLVSSSRVIGAIYVDSIRKPYGFRKEDLSLFTILSNRAAGALEKVRASQGKDGAEGI